jgi:hypothetical protein
MALPPDYESNLCIRFSLSFGADATQKTRQLSLAAHYMATRLSRELRDEIYSYLWDDEILAGMKYPPLSHSYCAIEKRNKYPIVCSCTWSGEDTLKKKNIPLFARSQLVGCMIAKEVVQWLYENVVLTIGQVYSDSSISGFLPGDVFEVGLVPQQCSLPGLCVKQDLTLFEKSELERERNLTIMTLQLSSLVQIKKKEGFQLNYKVEVFNHECVGIILLYDWMTKVKYVIGHLRDTGMLVNVSFCNSSLDEVTDDLCVASTYYFDFDVTDKLDCTPNEWITWLKQQRQELMRVCYHCPFQQDYSSANSLGQSSSVFRRDTHLYDNDIELMERKDKEEKRKLFRETILTYARQMRQAKSEQASSS